MCEGGKILDIPKSLKKNRQKILKHKKLKQKEEQAKDP